MPVYKYLILEKYNHMLLLTALGGGELNSNASEINV